MIVMNKFGRTDCVCDSGHEWCCNNKRRVSARSARLSGLGGWAGVSDSGAVDYCKSRWPKLGPQQWATCGNIIKTNQDPTPFMEAEMKKLPGSSTAADIFGGIAKAISGGITGAAQANAAAGTAALLAQQQAAKARQTQMLVVLGVVGLGAFMLLRNRGGE